MPRSPSPPPREDAARLRRALGLPALACYGVGGMLGGGIYVLIGGVAGAAGPLGWLSFALAMAVAAPTRTRRLRRPGLGPVARDRRERGARRLRSPRFACPRGGAARDGRARSGRARTPRRG